MAYADLTEEQKEKAREAHRKWAAKNDRSAYYHEYEMRRTNKKERQEQAAAWIKDRPEKASEYRKRCESNKSREFKMFRAARKRAQTQDREFTLEREDIIIPEICPCCDNPIDRPSLDRVDNELGYVKGNIDVICTHCNSNKRDGTAKLHRQIAEYMERHKIKLDKEEKI